MRAIRLHRLGDVPRVEEVDDPSGDEVGATVSIRAVSLNPADLAIAKGTFYRGHPPLPFVPGLEAVGVMENGALVYVAGDGLGLTRDGVLRERVDVDPKVLIELPAGADPVMAVALGAAGLTGWLPITWKAETGPGDIVLVLGATGTAGSVAVQAARAAGAGRVVAAGRNSERLGFVSRFADATVSLDDPDYGDQLVEACEPGASVVFDPLWGQPVEAALLAAAVGARIVHVGQAAGPTASVRSDLVRGKRLALLGYSSFGVPEDVAREAYLEMISRLNRGELEVQVQRSNFSEAPETWREFASNGGKHVIEMHRS